MPIQTDKNGNYGPPLVSQKYSPLSNIVYAAADTPLYSRLLTNRLNLLTNSGLFPQPLRLAVPNWPATIAAEAGHNPPLVVISSNRSTWIKKGIEAAAEQLASMPGQPATFADASDLHALGANAGQTQSPPIYCPTRLGAAPNRNVYVVVHILEYNTYKRTLADTGITVVGWQFVLPVANRAPRNVWIAGFGASRFAAIEFCKKLRTAAAAAAGGAVPWNYAWLLDDNVVALTNFAGFAAVEGAMTAAAVGAGFQGGTSAEAFQSNRDWAKRELDEKRGGQAADLPASLPPGIIQQTALWNIAYLTAHFLNFSPVYIASGEDLSFVNYFNTTVVPYFYYGGITVRKEDTDPYDNGVGAANLDAARQRITAWVAAAEAANPPGAVPPPPIEVQPTAPGDGGVQTLARFVIDRVLPNSPMAGAAGNAAVQDKAKCQGVEQITCGAINLGHVTAPAMAATFQINGAAAQVIVQDNLP